VARATGGKGIRPILANVLVSAEHDEMMLVGTDLEIMMTCRLKAVVEVPGRYTISAKLLSEVVTTLPIENENAQIQFDQLEGNENTLQLSSGKAKSNLQIQGIEEFPPLPVLEGESFPRFDFPSHGLRKSLREVAIAVSTDDTNPSQKSICLSFLAGELRLIATDSRRLAVTKMTSVAYPPEFERNYLVPSRAVNEVIKLLEGTATINVGLFKEQLVFTNDRFLLITRLYDGKFPDYQRVLPKEFSRRLTCGHKDFVQALRTVNPIARHSSFMVRLDIGPNETRLWAESREEGTSEVFLSSKLEGEPINVAFNGKYVQDFLNVVETDEISLDLTTPSYPGVLKPVSPDNQFHYVVMPMTF
jgi:DNA polymerase-3 subunit beta